MTVSELIEILESMPCDAPVLVKGYEGGVDEAESAEVHNYNPNVNTAWYYGKHELDKDGICKGVLLS